MAKKIYQTRNGIRTELTTRQVKAYVMKVRGWTSEQYKKEYDKLRNSLRTYEAFKKRSGVEEEAQSPSHLLYFEARAMKREGENYKRTIELERIYSFPALSTGQTLTKRLSGEATDFIRKYRKGIAFKFGGFIKKNPMAKELVRKIKDPVKLEQALTDYANELYVKIKKYRDDQETAAIPFGPAIGSDTAIEFDIESYL